MNSLSIFKNRKMENTAVRKFILSKGYELLATSFWTNDGLIDLVLKDRSTGELVFLLIEHLETKNFINRFKQKNITKEYLIKRNIFKNIFWYLNKYKIKDKEIRLDLIQVYLVQNKAKIKHRKNISNVSELNNFDLLRDAS